MNFIKKCIQLNKKIIRRRKYFILYGTITSGFGSGKYYLNKKYYKINITKILKKNPYPGTLNVNYNHNNCYLKNILLCYNNYIKGTYYDNTYLGGIKLFKCSIHGTLSFIIIPDINHHDNNVLEIITIMSLRKKYNLKDGESIKIKIYY